MLLFYTIPSNSVLSNSAPVVGETGNTTGNLAEYVPAAVNGHAMDTERIHAYDPLMQTLRIAAAMSHSTRNWSTCDDYP